MNTFDTNIGSKIYEWTVINIEGEYCECRCSCGVIRYVNRNNLAHGLSKSCGHTRRNDLTGQQFGEWKVISYVGRKDRKSFYLCQCSCGVQKEIRSYDLTHEITKSCGHVAIERRNSLIGKHFGDWEVISIIGDGKALCRCSCGVQKEVALYSLKSGLSKSCGHDTRGHTISIGDKIDDLNVIGKGNNNKWRCSCKCGAILDKSAYDLNNYSQVCSGTHKCQIRDLVGETFGEWTVLEKVKGSVWKCQCSCGTIANKDYYLLASGASKHCASDIHTNSKLIDLTGEHFGRLTVIGYKKPYWICKCSCGNTVDVLSHNLRNGSTNSCGCLRLSFSRDDIIKAINNFDEKPFIFELAEELGTQEYNVRKYIKRYDLYNLINRSFRSRYEKEIVDYLSQKGISNILVSDRNVIRPHELDIYLPDRKVAIEFNGDYWHSERIKDKYYHQQKTIACIKQGIHLIHIFEHEWKNNHDNILDIIDTTLNIDINRIYARNTIVRKVEAEEAKKFISKNHLQGYTPANINLGCFYNNELVGVMTFGTPRFNNSYQYEMIRCCWKSHISVVGGMQKLFSFFIKNYDVQSIVTYCDMSKFTGNSYIGLGFRPVGKAITQPGYVWYDSTEHVALNRYKTQKANLVRLGLDKYGDTEDEIMYALGYYKIYNSGNLVMEWRK